MDVRYYDIQMVLPLRISTKINTHLLYLSSLFRAFTSFPSFPFLLFFSSPLLSRSFPSPCPILSFPSTALLLLLFFAFFHRAYSLDELLRSADFVPLHVRLAPQTKNMSGAKEIALMKKVAYLLNASR